MKSDLPLKLSLDINSFCYFVISIFQYAISNLILFLFFHLLVPTDSDNQFFRVVPVDMTITEGDDVELECTVGNQKGSVQWSKDGFLLGKY